MEILLEKESNITKHGFFCKIQNGTDYIIIKNAYQSNYAKGWKDYAPFQSIDGITWERTLPGSFNGKEFSFFIKKDANYVCWFPPYQINKIQEMNSFCNKHNENMIVIGNLNHPKIILLSGQHPGESMGLYFIEGVINTINEGTILDKFSFIIFPTINLEGIKAKNHRLTPKGIDLNRSWNKNCPELNPIKDEIKKLNNIYAIIDIHGDEVSQKDYIIYNKYFKNTKLSKAIQENKFEILKKQCFIKKFIKNLIRNKKIITLQGKTARDFFEKKGITSVTMELSAKNNTPETCINKGRKLIQSLDRN